MKKITKTSTACGVSSPPASHTWETLEVFARGEVLQFIQRLLEEEVDDLLGRKKPERRAGRVFQVIATATLAQGSCRS